jgi:GAF domain-containing protein
LSTHRPQLPPVSGTLQMHTAGARRRRPPAQRALHDSIAWNDACGDEPAQSVLQNTLRSACAVIGAQQGFVLLLRDDSTLEVACAQNLQPRQLLDFVLGSAARALHHALTDHVPGLADASGTLLAPAHDGERPSPSIIAMPLELGSRHRGALCLLSGEPPRTLSTLDLEILGALSEQASLAMRAANQHSALSRLAASLRAFTPQPA